MYNKLLKKQISKHLTPDCINNPVFKDFIKSVNDSYTAFERDRELMNHAFLESEKEYNEINNNLKKEYELKKQSIANLFDSLDVLEDDFKTMETDEIGDILYISKYLNKQIEKRKEIENNLSTTVELLKTLLANLQSGILVEDENRRILFTNQLFCDMFSIPVLPDLLIGADCTNAAEQSKHLFKYPHLFPERIDQILHYKKLTTNEILETVEGKFLERDYIPIVINNVYKGHLWKYTDITKRIETHIQLEQSEERSRLIMDSSLNAIITVDTSGRINFWNKQAEVIFGWKENEVIGKLLTETIIPNSHRERHQRGFEKFLETKEGAFLNKQMELPAIKKSGVEFPVEISIIPVFQDDNMFFCSFIQDISERKKAENKLRFQEEKFRNIIANMNLGLIEVDNDEIIQFTNQSFADISGFDKEELIGKNASELFILGENLDLINEKIKLRSKGVSDIYQVPVRNKRGELRWWAISGAPNFDDKGNQIGSIGIHLDITEQKQLEIELEKEKIKAEEASKAKEAFLANMSHEIRTPLNAIVGFLRELEKQQLTFLQKKYIENSSIASKHLLSIINNILDISKIEAGEMSLEHENFVLEKTVSNVISILLPKAIQKDIKLVSKIEKNVFPVLKGDSLRLEQILFNLVGNSLKFTPKGQITIYCKLISECNTHQEICLSIKDTGIGMDESYIENIFNKFSQEDKDVTRKYGGTGLGMPITKELVQLMNGRIEIKSKKNIGTKISVFISLEKGDISGIKHESILKKTNIDDTKILLVEDNDLNRMVAQNSLQYFNCKITEAENGVEAIEILKKQKFDIILMDIQMPEMDGIEATKIIREELEIKTPIIALTANAFKTEIEKCKKAGMNDYITKPFEENTLLETISKNLIKSKNKNSNEEEKLYDLTSLNSLSRGNSDFVNKMINIFKIQTADTIIKIDTAFLENNFEEISRLIHKIKPSIEGMGVFSVYEEVKLLEKMSKETTDKEKMYELFTFIKEVLIKVIKQLKTIASKQE